MKHFFQRHYVFPLLVVPLALSMLLLPLRIAARPHQATADFVAPMSEQAAQAAIARARQYEAERRDVLLGDFETIAASGLPTVQTVYIPQTGHHLSDRAGFLQFWRANGGVLIFGYPLSEEIVEEGRIVQYFERARFEYHPEAASPADQVQLALLGRELSAGREFPAGTPDSGERYFPETGHGVSGPFLQYWEKRGGLPIFGYPLSEPLQEISPIDGQTYTVQYFERARFELHPEALAPFYSNQAAALGLRLLALETVQLGDLGRQAALLHGVPISSSAPLDGVPAWSPLLWERHIDVDLSTQWLTAYENDTPVFHAPVATGRDGFNTPTGSFAIYSRLTIQTMTGSSGGESWYVPDIPWVQYVVGGVALHGTYWHDRWGSGLRMSHGCINLNIDDAEWLYRWADLGTTVTIHY